MCVCICPLRHFQCYRRIHLPDLYKFLLESNVPFINPNEATVSLRPSKTFSWCRLYKNAFQDPPDWDKISAFRALPPCLLIIFFTSCRCPNVLWISVTTRLGNASRASGWEILNVNKTPQLEKYNNKIHRASEIVMRNQYESSHHNLLQSPWNFSVRLLWSFDHAAQSHASYLYLNDTVNKQSIIFIYSSFKGL